MKIRIVRSKDRTNCTWLLIENGVQAGSIIPGRNESTYWWTYHEPYSVRCGRQRQAETLRAAMCSALAELCGDLAGWRIQLIGKDIEPAVFGGSLPALFKHVDIADYREVVAEHDPELARRAA